MIWTVPVWYVLAFVAACGLLGYVGYDMLRISRKEIWPYGKSLGRTTAENAADARPITRTRELSVLAEAAAHVLNSASSDEQREALRDHFIAVLEEELRAGEWSRSRGDVRLAQQLGMRVSGGGGW